MSLIGETFTTINHIDIYERRDFEHFKYAPSTVVGERAVRMEHEATKREIWAGDAAALAIKLAATAPEVAIKAREDIEPNLVRRDQALAEREKDLMNAREDIMAMSVDNRLGFSRVLNNQASPYLEHLYDTWAADKPFYKPSRGARLRGALGRKSAKVDRYWTDWIELGATDQQLMNLLQWNSHRITELQKDPEIIKAIEEQKTGYKKGLARGFEAGYLTCYIPSVEKDVDATKVIMSEYTDTIAQKRSGYVVRGIPRAYIAEGSPRRKTKHVKSSTKHELNHAALGSFDEGWMDEAITEHIATAMDKDNWGEIVRKVDFESYKGCRSLVRDMLDAPEGKIELKLVTRAYSAHHRRGEELHLMNQSIDHCYGLEPRDDYRSSWVVTELTKMVKEEMKSEEAGELDRAAGVVAARLREQGPVLVTDRIARNVDLFKQRCRPLGLLELLKNKEAL